MEQPGADRRIRAVIFDAGNTLLEMDYEVVATQLRSRGHDVSAAAVMQAERRARVRLDHEQAAQATRARRGEGRYLRYLLEALGIGDDAEHRAITAASTCRSASVTDPRRRRWRRCGDCGRRGSSPA